MAEVIASLKIAGVLSKRHGPIDRRLAGRLWAEHRATLLLRSKG